MYSKARQHIAILLLPATSLSGEIWLLVFDHIVNHPFGSMATGSRGASEATATVWAGTRSSGRPHTCLCLSWWHCNLLPAWRPRQLIQHWISFMPVTKSYLKTLWWASGLSIRPLPLSVCAGCIPQIPSWCRTSPLGESIFNRHDLFTGWQNEGLRAEY